MPVTVAAWYSPQSLVTHLSERCARTQGRPARECEGGVDLLATHEGTWCGRCATEERRVALMEGK